MSDLKKQDLRQVNAEDLETVIALLNYAATAFRGQAMGGNYEVQEGVAAMLQALKQAEAL